jgi:hypothetical protein
MCPGPAEELDDLHALAPIDEPGDLSSGGMGWLQTGTGELRRLQTVIRIEEDQMTGWSCIEGALEPVASSARYVAEHTIVEDGALGVGIARTA